MNRRFFVSLTAAALCTATLSRADAPACLSLEGGEGPGKGKHIVLLAGDEEYRSEEGLPMLAGILSKHHGFKCTVLFSVDAKGNIDPNNQTSITNSAALDSADAIIMLLRFRHWPDEDMKHFVDAVQRGVPIIGLRTATHAFSYDGKSNSSYKSYHWSNAEGGFGRKVLGETWVSHWGNHMKEATLGVVEPSAKSSPVLNGVKDVFGDTDVYEAQVPDDANILLRGRVLSGMTPDSAPADYKKKPARGKPEQGVNDPMQPIAWTREVKNEAGKINRILTTTMGAATDLQNEGLRRLVVNGIYWGLKMEVPAAADVTLTGEYKPSAYRGGGFKKGVKPADTALKASK